jgi:hypothetical protein
VSAGLGFDQGTRRRAPDLLVGDEHKGDRPGSRDSHDGSGRPARRERGMRRPSCRRARTEESIPLTARQGAVPGFRPGGRYRGAQGGEFGLIWTDVRHHRVAEIVTIVAPTSAVAPLATSIMRLTPARSNVGLSIATESAMPCRIAASSNKSAGTTGVTSRSAVGIRPRLARWAASRSAPRRPTR